MSYPTQYINQIKNIKAWVKRKKDKGINVTSDDIWYKIGELNPNLGEEAKEYIWERI